MSASYPSSDARQIAILLRISADLDVVGDVSVTVNNPSELLAWSEVLAHPTTLAWRAGDSGNRYIHVSARHRRSPVRGDITAVLVCERHRRFWEALLPGGDLEPGAERALTHADLEAAWQAMPISPPDP